MFYSMHLLKVYRANISSVRPYLVLILGGIIFALMFSVFSSSTSFAARSQPDNRSEAEDSMNRVCRSGSRAAFSAYSRNVSLNENNGRVSFETVVLHRTCSGGGNDTRAYAVTGNSDLCPRVGSYGLNGGDAYDCTKYVGSPAFSGASSLSCRNGRNQQCVYGDFNQIRKDKNQPATNSVEVTVISKSHTIPNWDTRKKSAGSETYGRAGALCQFYKFGRNFTQNTGGSIDCQDLRVTVRWNPWNLDPRVVGIANNSKVSIDTIVRVTPRVVNTGGKSDNTLWRFGRIVVPPGASGPRTGGVTNDTAPNAFYGTQWQQVRPDARRDFTAENTTDLAEGSYYLDEYEIGSKVCWTLSVSTPKPSYVDNARWRHSQPLCIVVVPQPIRPQVQVLGYDTRLTGIVKTSLSRQLQSNTFYGSWGEYGVLSSNVNNNFASSAGLKAGGSVNQSDWSSLTFANRQSTQIPRSSCYSGGGFGCTAYRNSGVSYPQTFVDNMRSRCPTPITNNNITIPALSNTASTQFFCTNGTATISQDITYSDASTASANSLPQVVIIASNIIIDPSVKQVDAWLIAGASGNQTSLTGRISTCSAVRNGGNLFPSFSSINSLFYGYKDTCKEPLSVTGPVVANKLFLYRTTSPQDADKNLDQNLPPAERFNLRADAFLWAFNGGTSTPTDPVAQTVSIKELPPRF